MTVFDEGGDFTTNEYDRFGKVGYSRNNTTEYDFAPDVDNVVEHMRHLSYGAIPYTYPSGNPDDTNCSTFFGYGLTNSPWYGQTTVDGLYRSTPKEFLVEGEGLKDYVEHHLSPADILLYGHNGQFGHAAMATETANIDNNGILHRGLIQNGFTMGGGYETDDPRRMTYNQQNGSFSLPLAVIRAGEYYRNKPELLDINKSLSAINTLYGGRQQEYHNRDLQNAKTQMQAFKSWEDNISKYAKDYINK